MLHRDSIVQVTHDLQTGQQLLLKKGMAGRVLSTAVLHRACVVEFAINNGQSVVVRVSDDELAEVRPNARA
jgi:hypothetical protein